MHLTGYRNMKEFIDNILNKNLTEALTSFKKEIASIVKTKLSEQKKIIVAEELVLNEKKKHSIPFSAAGRAKTNPDDEEETSTRALKWQRLNYRKFNASKDIKEAAVGKDGLIHLATGEAVLPSVYRQRRWLAESNEWSDWMGDTYHDLKDHKDKNVKHHLRMAMAQHKKGNTEDAHEHMKAAQTAAHKLEKSKEKIEEGSKEDDKHFEKQDKKKQDKLNAVLRQGKSYAEAKKKMKLKEDCGLDPDKEKKVEAAREAARAMLQPQLDTTAPRVDRSIVSIPKGTRPADRLTAPDLGPKEDEWKNGKKLEEAKEAIEEEKKVSGSATKAFLEKKPFKSKNTKSTGDELHLHGNKIAYHKEGKIHATMAGWPTSTTKERLNSLSRAVGGEKFYTKGGKHYYGDREIKSDEHVELTKKKDD